MLEKKKNNIVEDCRESPVERQQQEGTQHGHAHQTDNAGRAGHWQAWPQHRMNSVHVLKPACEDTPRGCV